MAEENNINEVNFTVDIAGEGSLMNDYKNRYLKLVTNGSLTFRGNIKNIYELLNSCSLVCFPSLWEGYPNALIEALYCGLPIVTTSRMSDLGDFIEHNFNGLIVEDKELLSNVQYLLNEHEMLNTFSENSFYKYSQLSQQDPQSLWLKLLEGLTT